MSSVSPIKDRGCPNSATVPSQDCESIKNSFQSSSVQLKYTEEEKWSTFIPQGSSNEICSDQYHEKGKKKKIQWWQTRLQEGENLIILDIGIASHNFELPHEVYAEASDYKLGTIWVQNDKPTVFCSEELSNPQDK